MENILVFPAGTEIALEIHDALQYSKFVCLYGATSVPCHADFVFSHFVDEAAPFADDPALIPWLNRIIDRYGIDWIYPAHDSALLTLAENRERLHCPIVAAPTETVRICRDKNLTYRHLAGSWYLPAFYSSAAEVPAYPVFIKPAVGQGSVGARRIDSREALEEALSDGVEYAICEYLPGEEYTVDCFTDRHGELRFAGCRVRDRILAGIAVHSHALIADEEIRCIAEDINRKLTFTGAWFFQVKRNRQGEYRLLEIAPRIAGTMGLTRNRGVNMEMLTLFTLWGYDVDILVNEVEIHLDRAFGRCFRTDLRYDTVYLDFADTLRVKDRIDPQMLRFLYQARNQGKRLTLFKPAEERLEDYALPEELFDAILPDDMQTKLKMVQGSAILIDDDVSVRKALHARGVPVFSPDMTESLMDARR